ncbi:MAG: membrane protein insertion efficiency factor YidD [Bacilli bacterium]|nr:membrane protein insertion efficiency factor YidD [Bacilli bacterium]
MSQLLIKIIKLYQSMPINTHSRCRFTPTCSQYMIDAINMYGSHKGVKLGIKRILRCHPLGKYGYDPVKENL